MPLLKRKYKEASKTNKYLLDLRKNREMFYKTCTSRQNEIKKVVAETIKDSITKNESSMATSTQMYSIALKIKDPKMKPKCCSVLNYQISEKTQQIIENKIKPTQSGLKIKQGIENLKWRSSP